MRQIEFRDSVTERKLFASHKIPGQLDRTETDRDSCPEMSGFVVPLDFSTGTVPQIFVPVSTVVCRDGRLSRDNAGTPVLSRKSP